MIDMKKKVQAARDYASKSGFMVQRDKNADKHFLDGIDWAEKEIFKDLLHPASEVPRNDNGKILAFSKVNSNMNAMLNETACYTYQGKWKVRVREYTFTDLAFSGRLT